MRIHLHVIAREFRSRKRAGCYHKRTIIIAASMSIIWETGGNRRTIPSYSDETNVDQHAENSLDLAMKNVDAAMKSRKLSDQTEEDVFSADQTESILRELRSFTLDGLKITNCIFRSDHVEICYLFDRTDANTKDELRQQLADHLKISSKLIKMTKLRTKPICKETSIRPGETAINRTTGVSCKTGAFVKVEGKGNHALTNGHGKSKGDVLQQQNGNPLGVVSVSLRPPLQPSANENWCCYYNDVALVRLEQQDGYIAQVLDYIRGPLGLSEQPIYATNNMMVRRFTTDGRRGRVDSKDYIIRDYEFNIEFRLMSIVGEDGGPIHDEGDSGILVATDAPVNGKVSAVGILVRLERMEEDDDEGRVRMTSLAVPLLANFEALRCHPYCNEASIRFIN